MPYLWRLNKVKHGWGFVWDGNRVHFTPPPPPQWVIHHRIIGYVHISGHALDFMAKIHLYFTLPEVLCFCDKYNQSWIAISLTITPHIIACQRNSENKWMLALIFAHVGVVILTEGHCVYKVECVFHLLCGTEWVIVASRSALLMCLSRAMPHCWSNIRTLWHRLQINLQSV